MPHATPLESPTDHEGLPLPVAVVTGLLLAPLKVILSFFPLFNLVDVVLFLAAGVIFGRWSGRRRWALGVALSLPAALVSGYFVVRVGAGLLEGVGLGWALSVVLVPVSALVGVHVGARSHRA